MGTLEVAQPLINHLLNDLALTQVRGRIAYNNKYTPPLTCRVSLHRIILSVLPAGCATVCVASLTTIACNNDMRP
jgi:hypothetical protein